MFVRIHAKYDHEETRVRRRLYSPCEYSDRGAEGGMERQPHGDEGGGATLPLSLSLSVYTSYVYLYTIDRGTMEILVCMSFACCVRCAVLLDHQQPKR